MSNLNIDFSFYRDDSPETVLAKYLESYKNLYDQSRYDVTASFICRHVSLQDIHVLDVGCGGGMWSSFFASRAAKVTSTDIRPHVVDAAKLYVSRDQSLSNKHNIHWFAGDIVNYPYEEKFDLVFLKDVIEHVEEEVKFIQEIAQRVSEKGLIYIATQNALSLNYLVEGAYETMINGNKSWCGWDPTHIRFYNPGKLMTLARTAGFRTVAWHGMYHLPYRFVSHLVFKKLVESKAFHWIERYLGEMWPFSQTGWAIGVLMQRGA
jgi:2-polyprenyl-6-hydroxyphenyl methylase/3-demethylubiquinone-9 3-methyltransferase